MKTPNKYYAYVLPSGRRGLVSDWKQCEKLVSGVMGARYRGFASKQEAEAWLAAGAAYEPKPKLKKHREPGIYFDAGTGRGLGVEINVTDAQGKSLLHKTMPPRAVSRFGTHRLKDKEATNNFGELLALRQALELAMRGDIKKIFGDSRLVIDYWSKWRMKRKDLPAATVKLAEEVSALRELYEAGGGKVVRISGDVNPADLGFHK
jgi:ribonuclease HI